MEPRHPIRTVSRRTGLTAHVIRAWEKRFGVVQPGRTGTNRRVYSDEDIDRLDLLARATKAGHRISEVAQLSNPRLRELVELATPSGRPDPFAVEAPEPQAEYRRLALEAVARLDAERLADTLDRAAARLSRVALLENLVVPLMQAVGDGWRDGRFRIVHEHLATAIVRSLLGRLELTHRVPESAHRIVCATPVGQLHELGALGVAATASAEGWRVTYLGANVPAVDLISAGRADDARALALSISYPGDDPVLVEELLRLGEALPARVRLLVGGQSAKFYRDTLERIRAVRIEDIHGLRTVLRELDPGAPRALVEKRQ